jgi:endonuclease/exonuclease/phosphatase family metal-dependent hydrolase
VDGARRSVTLVDVPVAPLIALRLMTYNLNYANPDVATTLDVIADADADVVLLQEVSPEWRDALEHRFAARFPHRSFRVSARMAGGLGVLSKLPIEREDVWGPPVGTGAWFPAARMVLATPFGALQLVNVHLRPALDQGSWVRGFMVTPPLRKAEIEAHWKRVDYSLPTIVAGDFNEDATGLAIDYLQRHGMSRVSTTGPTTWHYEASVRGTPTDLLKMDIDHVMIDGHLTARDGHVMDAGTSDHRPVVVTIAPKPAAPSGAP